MGHISMGFFGIFKKEEKTYTLEEAIKAIEKKFSAESASQREETYNNALKIHNEWMNLRELLKDFESKPIPHNAKSSANVKERFCRIAIEQLGGLKQPDRSNPTDFIYYSRKLFHSLGGLTERQLLHMGVFFREDIEPVSRQMKEINLLIQPKNVDKGSERAISLAREIKDAESRIGDLKKKTAEFEKISTVLNSKKPEIKETHVDNSGLIVAERKVQRVKQEIDSLLSVQKFLKKYAHDKEIKDPLIGEYIDSPSSAILHDQHFRIIRIIEEARSFDDTGKAESIISRENIIRSKRLELIQAINEAERVKKEYESASNEAASRAVELRRKHATIEAEIRDNHKLLSEAKEELDAANALLTDKKVELYLLASNILNAKIV